MVPDSQYPILQKVDKFGLKVDATTSQISRICAKQEERCCYFQEERCCYFKFDGCPDLVKRFCKDVHFVKMCAGEQRRFNIKSTKSEK